MATAIALETGAIVGSIVVGKAYRWKRSPISCGLPRPSTDSLHNLFRWTGSVDGQLAQSLTMVDNSYRWMDSTIYCGRQWLSINGYR